MALLSCRKLTDDKDLPRATILMFLVPAPGQIGSGLAGPMFETMIQFLRQLQTSMFTISTTLSLRRQPPMYLHEFLSS